MYHLLHIIFDIKNEKLNKLRKVWKFKNFTKNLLLKYFITFSSQKDLEILKIKDRIKLN